MRRTVTIVLGLACLSIPASAKAGMPIPEPPLPQRVALADAIVCGTVTALEEELVEASPVPKLSASRKLPYRIAVVKVQEAVCGLKDRTVVRVGFVSPPPSATQAPGVRKLAQIKLTVDQKACFFLHRHPDESFYVLLAVTDVIDAAKAKNFERDRALVKRCAALLEDPNAGLRASDAESRWLTAAMLVFRYRTPSVVYRGPPKTEFVDAEQSRLILAGLADGPWSAEAVRSQMSPVRLFLRLDLGADDGWQPPESLDDLPAAIKKWIAENGARCRIRRYAVP
jgi:hypothetical protein